MLQTTVNYLNVLETGRHNLVTERQTEVDLAIKQGELDVHRGQLAETSRHNRVTESQGWASILETQRHNLVTEGIQTYDAETRRMQIGINEEQLKIHAFDADTRRFAAVSSAGIGWANVAINQGQLEVAQRRVNNDFALGMSSYQNNYTQAQSSLQNANTRQEELSHTIDYDSNMLNINQQNADTNRMNAETNQYNAAINAWSTSIEENKRKDKKLKDISTEIREWFKLVPESSQTKMWWTLFPPG